MFCALLLSRWPTERVEVLVQYCLHNKLVGRRVSPRHEREITMNPGKMEDHQLSSHSGEANTQSTSFPSSSANEVFNCEAKFWEKKGKNLIINACQLRVNRRWLKFLLLYLSYVFRALINSLVCWFLIINVSRKRAVLTYGLQFSTKIYLPWFIFGLNWSTAD